MASSTAVRGGNPGERAADRLTFRVVAPPFTPGWTLGKIASHSLDFWLASEDLPDSENRVTLDRNGKIVLTYKPNNTQGHDRLRAKLQGCMKQTVCSIHGHDCDQGLCSLAICS